MCTDGKPIAGQVQHIRARSTVIRTNDDIVMIVPNTHFIRCPRRWQLVPQLKHHTLGRLAPYSGDFRKFCEVISANCVDHLLGGHAAQHRDRKLRANAAYSD